MRNRGHDIFEGLAFEGLALVGLLWLSGCTSLERSAYHPLTEEGGYNEREIKDNWYNVQFTGNQKMQKKTAVMFAMARAVEICRVQGFSLASLLLLKDVSKQRTVRKSHSSTYQAPSYLNGSMSEQGSSFLGGFNGNWSGTSNFQGVATGGQKESISSSWDETEVTPRISLTIRCTNKVYRPLLETRQIASEKVSIYTKDFLDSLEIVDTNDKSPNIKNRTFPRNFV